MVNVRMRLLRREREVIFALLTEEGSGFSCRDEEDLVNGPDNYENVLGWGKHLRWALYV